MTDPTPDTPAADTAGTPAGGTHTMDTPATGTSAEDVGITDTPTSPEAGTEAPVTTDDGSGSDEAKRYRLRLRETETERDGLRTRLEASHRREVERLAGGSLADPSDLWSSAQLTDMLSDDGDVDNEKVTAAVEALVTAKPHYKRTNAPKPDPTQGARGGGVSEPKMGDIFKGK